MKIAILGTGKVAHALGSGWKKSGHDIIAAIEVLADPSLVGLATVFVSGDEEAAKTEVKGLLHDLGWKDEGIIELGGIQTARGRSTTPSCSSRSSPF
jgi:predicted dinucleotide-binding enzyme